VDGLVSVRLSDKYIKHGWYSTSMGMKSNRTEQIKVNVTEDEKRKIQEIAEKKGQSLSSYGRLRMLPTPQVTAE